MTHLFRSVALVALTGGMLVGASQLTLNGVDLGAAYADSHGGGTEGHGGGQGAGGKGGNAGAGHGGGQGAGGAGGKGGHATTSGEEEEDPDKKGPKYGKPEPGTRGGQPNWAGEDFPEVELGRLNVARAPANIIDRARQELVDNISNIDLTAYASIEAYLAEIADWDNAMIIDSPLENLAVFRDAINGVSTPVGAPTTDLIAIALGTASDKAMEISEDTVTALSIIFGVDPATLDIEAIARDAEIVRDAVAEAHG